MLRNQHAGLCKRCKEPHVNAASLCSIESIPRYLKVQRQHMLHFSSALTLLYAINGAASPADNLPDSRLVQERAHPQTAAEGPEGSRVADCILASHAERSRKD
jgi:hypothetical protein